ncbi:MAG: succinate dehydrogenase, partial [Leucobacter sp.]
MTMTIDTPRSQAPAKKRTNWEKWGWIYMRVSGVLLVVLVFGHLFSNLIATPGGVHA